MIILRLPKKKALVDSIMVKYRRNLRRGLLLGDIAHSNSATYLMVPDEALSAAFLYSVYFKAKEKGLKVEAMYATSIDLDKVLPENVKKVAKAWTSRRLSKEEVSMLKNRFITPNLLEVILK